MARVFSAARRVPTFSIVSQELVIPSADAAQLIFFIFLAQSSGNGNDKIEVLVDTEVVLTIPEGTTAVSSDYTRVDLDISSYADGNAHSVTFRSTIAGGGTPTQALLDGVLRTRIG